MFDRLNPSSSVAWCVLTWLMWKFSMRKSCEFGWEPGILTHFVDCKFLAHVHLAVCVIFFFLSFGLLLWKQDSIIRFIGGIVILLLIPKHQHARIDSSPWMLPTESSSYTLSSRNSREADKCNIYRLVVKEWVSDTLHMHHYHKTLFADLLFRKYVSYIVCFSYSVTLNSWRFLSFCYIQQFGKAQDVFPKVSYPQVQLVVLPFMIDGDYNALFTFCLIMKIFIFSGPSIFVQVLAHFILAIRQYWRIFRLPKSFCPLSHWQ